MKYLAAVIALAGLVFAAAPASAVPQYRCAKCAPVKKYDSQQLIRKVKTVDRSRVINTYSVVYKKVHRHAPIVPQRVYATPAPVVVVNIVTQKYRITHGPHPDSAVRDVYPVAPRCKYGVSRSGSCVLRVRG